MACLTKNKLKRMQAKYKVDTVIAEKMNVSRQAIHQLRKKYNLPKVKDRLLDRNIKIAQSAQKNRSEADRRACVKYGLSISQVYRIIKAYS